MNNKIEGDTGKPSVLMILLGCILNMMFSAGVLIGFGMPFFEGFDGSSFVVIAIYTIIYLFGASFMVRLFYWSLLEALKCIKRLFS